MKETKQHHKHTGDASSPVEFVSLIASLVLLLAEGLSKSSFHKCQDQATAAAAWHPQSGGWEGWRARGGGDQNEKGEAEEVKIEDGE